MRRIALLVLLSTLTLLPTWRFSPDARAAQGPDCSLYNYQEDAQADFDKAQRSASGSTSFLGQLDPDGDGIACPELPPRPVSIVGDQRIGGDFNPYFDFIGIRGVGYSAHYTVRLAGIQLASGVTGAVCPDLVTIDTIVNLFDLPDRGRQFYLSLPMGLRIPPDERAQHYEIDALAWTVLDDLANPVMLNRWLLQSGLVVVDTSNIWGDVEQEFLAAQDSARSAGLGIWGACSIPEITTVPPFAPEGQILRTDGDGDQTVSFTIASEGLYHVTLDVGGGPPLFIAMDVYTTAGEWIPALSITSSSTGAFSSIAYLMPGAYYVQIKATDIWRVTISTSG